jgi:hypothetical protein
MTIEQFCEKHNACEDGRKWALAVCKDMQEVWENAKADWLVWVACRPGVLSEKDLRLFVCWCARMMWDWLDDPRSRNAVEVAERYAMDGATSVELYKAREEAQAAAMDVAAAVALMVPWGTARDVAWIAAGGMSESVAWAVSGAVLRAGAREPVWYAGAVAQADWLRKNTHPNFAD